MLPLILYPRYPTLCYNSGTMTHLALYWTRLAAWWRSLSRQWQLVWAGIATVVLVALLAVLVLPRLAPDMRLRFSTTDPWPAAIEQTLNLLDESPDFEPHLQSYRTIPSEIDDYLRLVERARVASTVFDELHKLSLPLVGNAWSVLVAILNNVFPGGGSALDGLDQALRQVLALEGQLASLRDADAVVPVLRQFRAQPSKKTLLALRDAVAQYNPVLAQADKDLQPHLHAINGAAERIDRIQQSLQRAEDTVSRIPVLPDLVRKLNQAIAGIFSPLRNVQQALNDLHNRLQADLATMQTIQEIVSAAEHPTSRR